MKKKSESLQKLQEFVTWIQRQSNPKVKRLRSNNRGEYNNKKSHAWFKEILCLVQGNKDLVQAYGTICPRPKWN